ncbi:MAG: NYN domain-containing protein [Acidimicrobiales bacterium]
MPSEHVVVDGSNIATEGRSAPSLAQLQEAVSEFRGEYSEAEITVIVDATFAHRIDPSELDRFEQAVLEGAYVHPPAGAIGRGDAFLLRIAQKVDAIVLSNDSFQEFHGEHPWLFERGRLLGATPVPGIGWIFTPRTPVRGPTSRKAVQDTKATDKARRKISKAIEAATKEAVTPSSRAKTTREREPAGATSASGRASRRGKQAIAVAAAVNDPLTFVSFIAEHPLGTEVDGEVETYTSHGAVVSVDNTQCYVPLANMAVPAPRSARELLKKGEKRSFIVTALDPQRRGVELAIPGVAAVSGRPSEEMIAAEVRLAKRASSPARKAVAKKTASPAKKARTSTVKAPETKPAAAPRKRAPAGKTAPRPTKTAPGKKAAVAAAKVAMMAKKAVVPATKAAAPRKKAAGAVAKETSPAKKSPAETSPAKKAPAKKAPARKLPAKQVAASATAATGTKSGAMAQKRSKDGTRSVEGAARKSPATLKRVATKKRAAPSPKQASPTRGPGAGTKPAGSDAVTPRAVTKKGPAPKLPLRRGR